MNILTNNSNINFGRKAILSCQVKEWATKNEINATMWEMEPSKIKDVEDVINSKNVNLAMKQDMRAANHKFSDNQKFYILQNEATNEVIAAAQTSHHYNPNEGKLEGKYTLIEECSSNAKYINGLEPLLAGIAQNSYESYDKNIITPPDMRNNTFKRARFSELKTGLQVLPEKRFAEFIDRASERSKIIMLNA